MITKYPYLTDTAFLRDFDELQLKEQFVKIIVLDWKENPVKEIQGQVTSGSLNVDGQSSVRRTCNITFVADEDQAHITNVNNLLSINKKIKLEIGFTNITKSYRQYKKIWFPLGTFLIINPSISHNNSGITISLQLKDKMCLLNGECGGVIPAAVDFATMEQYDENGELLTLKPTIYQIIQELVHHYGNEQLGKIIIEGLDKQVKQVAQWQGDKPLYLIEQKVPLGDIEIGTATSITTDVNDILSLSDLEYKEFTTGDDIGYQLVDFTYPDELAVDAGATVASVLDTIKEKLGNFEYFYDLDGNFVFQEIKNYLNTSYASCKITELKSKNMINMVDNNSNLYLVDRSRGKTAYRFSNQKIITSYANTPQYSMIKNDFVVWGTRKTLDGLEFPIRYHLAIDEKPQPGNFYEVFFYQDDELGYEIPFLPTRVINQEEIEAKKKKEGWQETGRQLALKYISFLDGAIRDPFVKYLIQYWIVPEHKETGSYSFIINWNAEEKRFSLFPYSCQKVVIKTTDWRTELFLQGLNAKGSGRDSNYYYTELVNEWPKLYSLKAVEHDVAEERENGQLTEDIIINGKKVNINQYYTGAWREETLSKVTSLDYFLDFIEPTTTLGGISVKSIGRRTKVLNDKGVNCIFEPTIPDYIFIEKDIEETDNEKNTARNRQSCVNKGYNYLQVNSNILDGISKGGHYNSAFYVIQDLLYQHTSYNESVTINCLPIYYLEPNVRIFIYDEKSDIKGDYVIKSLSLPLDVNGTMTITANKALDKI